MSEWARCKPWLEAACNEGVAWSIEDVEDQILAGDATFWPGKQCAAVTTFWEGRRGKVLNFWLLGGDLDELLNDMRPVIETWAKGQGASQVIGLGRPGWERALTPFGYRKGATLMMKDLP